VLTIKVEGDPVPQGSMRAFGNRIVHSNAKTLKPWRKKIVEAIRSEVEAWPGQHEKIVDSPVDIQITFWLKKPKSVKRWLPWVKPDLDKLIRAVLDAITESGEVWVDDAQVVSIKARKGYGDPCLFFTVDQVTSA
jgi:Holliday junction resolvase RusA-like endonuclease